MITLNTGETIAGLAEAAATVTVTITGMESGGVDTPKVLYQGQLGTSAATLYTVPGSTTAYLKSIHVVNTNTSSTRFFQLFAKGTADSNKITPLFVLPAGGYAEFGNDGWKIYNAAGQISLVGATGPAGPGLTDGDKGDVVVSGSGTVLSVESAAGAFAFTGNISPASITANQDNYNPTGLSTASTLRLTTSAAWNITGIVGGASGRVLRIYNIGSYNIVLKHDVTSTAANRFFTPGSTDYTILPGDGIELLYDATSSRWRITGSANPPLMMLNPLSVVYRATGADDGANLRALLASVAEGTTIFFPDIEYLFSTVDANGYAIHVTRDNITFKGRGVPMQLSADPTGFGNTVFKYIAPAPTTGELLHWGALTRTDDPPIGGGIEGIALNGGYRCDIALHTRKMEKAQFRNFWIGNANGTQWLADSFDHYTGGTDPNFGTKSNDFDRFSIWSYGTGPALVIDGDTTDAYHLYDDRWTRWKINHGSGGGILIKAGDDLWFSEGGIISATSAWSIDVTSNGTPTYNGPTGIWFNRIYCLTSVNPVIVRASGITKPPVMIFFQGLGTVDATKQIVVEPGAQVTIINDRGESNLHTDTRSSFVLTEDFAGGLLTDGAIGDYGWHLIGTGATVAYGGPSAQHVGIRRIDTGTTTNTLAGISFAGAGNVVFLPAAGFNAVFKWKPVQIDANVQYRIGFLGAFGVDPPLDGMWFERLSGDTNWFAVCSIGPTPTYTRVDTGVAAVAGTWYSGRIRRRNDTVIGFDIGNITNVQESIKISTNVPTAAVCPYFGVKPLTTTAKQLDVDTFQIVINGLDR